MKADQQIQTLNVKIGLFVAEKSDSALVQAALNGHLDSFTQLSQRYYPAIVAVAHAILGDRHLAEDAAQETMAKAARNLIKLKELDKFAGWLAAICRNVARDMARTTEPLAPLEQLAQIAEPPAELDDLTDTVRDAINALPARARELIYLRYYDGMTYQQISAVLGISHQAINGRLRRAKKNIAQHLRRDASLEVRL